MPFVFSSMLHSNSSPISMFRFSHIIWGKNAEPFVCLVVVPFTMEVYYHFGYIKVTNPLRL